MIMHMLNDTSSFTHLTVRIFPLKLLEHYKLPIINGCCALSRCESITDFIIAAVCALSVPNG